MWHVILHSILVTFDYELLCPLYLGVGIVGSYPVSCRISADTGDWHGYYAGAHHDNTERIHHFSTGNWLSATGWTPVWTTWKCQGFWLLSGKCLEILLKVGENSCRKSGQKLIIICRIFVCVRVFSSIQLVFYVNYAFTYDVWAEETFTTSLNMDMY